MRGVCDDLEMNYLGSFSANMDDLIQNEERERLLQFSKFYFTGIKDRVAVPNVNGGVKLSHLAEQNFTTLLLYSRDRPGCQY